MNLFQSLGMSEPVRIAVVGAGGKTTALFQLARQVKGNAWVTTTTHLGTDQLHLADRHFILRKREDIKPLAWMSQKVTLLTGERTPDDRMRAPDADYLDELATLAAKLGASLIVEADGARSHPIKAPAEREPVIPGWADCVIVVVGLSAIGKPLSPEWVHRPETFARLSVIAPGGQITIEGTVRMLLDPQGGLKGMPAASCKAVLFNQADVHPLDASDLQALHPLHLAYDVVLAAALGSQPDGVEIIP